MRGLLWNERELRCLNCVVGIVEDIREAFANGIRTKYILQKSLTAGGEI
jgi:hypothetical protein